MAGHLIHLEIVTPTSVVFQEDIEFFSFIGESGSMGILPGHLPLFTLVDIGVLEYQKEGQRDFISTMGGFLEFHDNRATLLTENAETADDVDALRAEAAAEKAKAHLTEKKGEDLGHRAADLEALKRASVRLKLAGLAKKRGKRRESLSGSAPKNERI